MKLHPRAEACGKIILLGEHSVVYGYPALAAGLPRGLVLEARSASSANAPCTLRIPDWNLDLELRADEDHPVARACLEVLTHCDGPVRGHDIVGRSPLPSRAGLGSSAALGVALARLVLGPDASVEEVVLGSLAGERVFHGTPSGIDSEVCARGGVMRFVRGEQPQAVRLGGELPLFVAASGIPRQTSDVVAGVARMRERRPRVVDPLLQVLGVLVDEGQHALESGDLDAFGECMNVAHETLSALGVSLPALDELCNRARKAGARGAKLTGAGGGGCIFALRSADNPSALDRAFADTALETFGVNIQS